MVYVEKTSCRVCRAELQTVLDFGLQCLGGIFPLLEEPDPPKAPLKLCVCLGCGLAQLGATVDPEAMFRDYGYRSGVTETMTKHLKDFAGQAMAMLPNETDRRPSALDIGGNDGTLLNHLGNVWEKRLIDPSNVVVSGTAWDKAHGYFPKDMPSDWKNFDLIFTVACFYDADDPVAFAQAVADNLAPDGLWCVEVADAARMVKEGGWDSICAEHLCYYDETTFRNICGRAGLQVVRVQRNDCNGGSIRFYVKRGSRVVGGAKMTLGEWFTFAKNVEKSRQEISEFLLANLSKKIHLLGASTKANTWLQAINAPTIVWDSLEVVSDRDPRKIGRKTPGTGIRIVSEEESRALRPDIYICGPWHFRSELIKREDAFLRGGGTLVFPLPTLQVVSPEQEW